MRHDNTINIFKCSNNPSIIDFRGFLEKFIQMSKIKVDEELKKVSVTISVPKPFIVQSGDEIGYKNTRKRINKFIENQLNPIP